MGTLSEKELSMINDALSEEDLLVKKYQLLASQTRDQEISSKFEQVAQRHQQHFNDIFALLG